MKKNKCHICNQFCSKSEKTLNLPNLKFISGTGKLMSVFKKYSFCQNSYFINTINNRVWKKMLKKSIQIIISTKKGFLNILQLEKILSMKKLKN